MTKSLLRQNPRNARHRNKIVTRYAATYFSLRQAHFVNTHSGLVHVDLVTIGLAGAIRSSLLGGRNVTALFLGGPLLRLHSKKEKLCPPRLAGNVLIAPSLPRLHPAFAGRCLVGFAARLARAFVPPARTRHGLWQRLLHTQCRHNRSACCVMPAIAASVPADHMIDGHVKGVFALSNQVHTVRTVSPAVTRSSNRQRNVSSGATCRIDSRKDPRTTRWHRKHFARRYLDHASPQPPARGKLFRYWNSEHAWTCLQRACQTRSGGLAARSCLDAGRAEDHSATPQSAVAGQCWAPAPFCQLFAAGGR
jgi:hypothetical protein